MHESLCPTLETVGLSPTLTKLVARVVLSVMEKPAGGVALSLNVDVVNSAR